MVYQYWTSLPKEQRLLYLIGLFSLITGLSCIFAHLVFGGTLEGPISWRKPFMFDTSLGVIQLITAWAIGYFPQWKYRKFFTVGLIGFAIALNVIFVTMQQARGTMSHFNWFTGELNAWIARGIIGVAIFAYIGILVVTVKSFSKLNATPSLAKAIRLFTLVAGIVLSMCTVHRIPPLMSS